MELIQKAILIAARAHDGQVDKGGKPYIMHPVRVMAQVKGEHAQMAAVLHDVVEDTSTTLQDLVKQGIPAEVIDALDALTKREGETRIDAARRAAENPIAMQVKIADVRDNMNLDRLPRVTEADRQRQREYENVLDLLLGREASSQIP